MTASRRDVLGGLCGAAVAAAAPGPVLARAPGVTRFVNAPWSRGGGAAWRQAEATRRLSPEAPGPAASWRENAELAHLAGVAAAQTLLDTPEDDPARRFELTPQALEALFAANGLAGELAGTAPVLFALRGCVIDDPAMAAAPLETAALRVATPDHMTPRCVIGVLQRASRSEPARLAVFSGSTTPNRHALALQAAAFAHADKQPGRPVWRIANTLASGLHRFSRGRHGGWHPAALRASDVQGRALRQPALRSTSGAFTVADLRLDAAVVMDNIHPAVTPVDALGAAFSSEGCLTLGEREPPARWRVDPPDWTAFSRLAAFGPGQPLREVRLALVSGAEAWLAATEAPVQRLRYGSRGPETAQLRRTLGLSASGGFDEMVLARVMARGAGPVAVVPSDPAAPPG